MESGNLTDDGISYFHPFFRKDGDILKSRFLQDNRIFFVLAENGYGLIEWGAYSTVGERNVNVVRMEVRDDDAVDIFQDFFCRHGKVIERHRQMLLHLVRDMVGMPGHVGDSEHVARESQGSMRNVLPAYTRRLVALRICVIFIVCKTSSFFICLIIAES